MAGNSFGGGTAECNTNMRIGQHDLLIGMCELLVQIITMGRHRLCGTGDNEKQAEILLKGSGKR